MKLRTKLTFLSISLFIISVAISVAMLCVAYRSVSANTKILLLLIAGIGILVSSGIVLLSLWIFRSVGLRSENVQIAVTRMDQGDLTTWIHSSGSDQISLIAARLLSLKNRLNDLIGDVKTTVMKSITNTKEMEDSVMGISTTVEVINGSIEGIRGEVTLLEDQVGKVKNDISSIGSGISSLNERTSDQAAMVEESTAAITQMMASIQSMTKITRQNQNMAQNLVESSDTGRTVFNDTIEKIDTIRESISKINEMVEIIDGIASRTNMLAMNAAIEAAHAGDAGRGFAVVAEEIRKLAEASGESSKDITQSIEGIILTIQAASDDANTMDEAFGTIEKNVDQVSTSITQIHDSLSETNEGGQQILSAMISLQSMAIATRDDASSMDSGAENIQKAMNELDMCSSRVFDGIAAISLMLDGFKDISETVQNQCKEVENSGADLESKISYFELATDEKVTADGKPLVRHDAALVSVEEANNIIERESNIKTKTENSFDANSFESVESFENVEDLEDLGELEEVESFTSLGTSKDLKESISIQNDSFENREPPSLVLELQKNDDLKQLKEEAPKINEELQNTTEQKKSSSLAEDDFEEVFF